MCAGRLDIDGALALAGRAAPAPEARLDGDPESTPAHAYPAPIRSSEATSINIAVRLFAELGYAAASLGEIAEAAGLRKASLYHHFPTKEALYAAVLDTAVVELRALLIGARLDEGDFAERLDRLGALITDYFADHPYAANLLSREMLENTAYLQGAGGEAIRINLEATTAFLAAGMDAGAFRRQDPRHLALSIVGLHVFYFASAIPGHGPIPRGMCSRPSSFANGRRPVLEQVRALCLVGNAPHRPSRGARRKPA